MFLHVRACAWVVCMCVRMRRGERVCPFAFACTRAWVRETCLILCSFVLVAYSCACARVCVFVCVCIMRVFVCLYTFACRCVRGRLRMCARFFFLALSFLNVIFSCPLTS